jgi:uncharacterized protein (TIGR02271 family)
MPFAVLVAGKRGGNRRGEEGQAMITEEQIPTVLEHPVHDADGNKIGKADHVFFDDVTGQPAWVSVKTGMFGMRESFVPLHNARIVEDHLEVPFSKDKVKDAPNVDVDAGGRLSTREEHQLYEHYTIGWGGPGQQTGAPGTGQDQPESWAAFPDPGQGDEDAMTRSEERMRVDTERTETGRVRLRKHVVTEEQQVTVPVRHEEVRVVREPITDANRDSAMTGEDITEAEHEVTLHAERPVVTTETVPVERVRLETEEKVTEETVKGTVRKERIETDTPDEDR